jgi:hypothetical protein
VVVVEAPALDDGVGLGQAAKHLLVQALVAQLAVEALDEAVLLRLAGGDVVPDAGTVGPALLTWTLVPSALPAFLLLALVLGALNPAVCTIPALLQ